MCRELFLNQSLEAGTGDESAGITMSKHIATDLLPPTANFLLLLKLMECDECSPVLLPTVIHPSSPFSFQHFHPLFEPFSLSLLIVLLSFSLSNPPTNFSVILFASFSRPPTLSCPCISQSLHSFIITLLSHHVDITVPTLIPSLYLILFALSCTHSFLSPSFSPTLLFAPTVSSLHFSSPLSSCPCGRL